jgi:transposase-like protein
MGILERQGRVIAGVVPDTKGDTLQPQIHKHVEPGSSVFTDFCHGYIGLNSHYAHEAVDHESCYVVGNVHTNNLENFWNLFKRGIKGTWVHVADAHLQRYVDEQTFRFNERFGGDGERFVTAMPMTPGKRLTYKNLTNNNRVLPTE